MDKKFETIKKIQRLLIISLSVMMLSGCSDGEEIASTMEYTSAQISESLAENVTENSQKQETMSQEQTTVEEKVDETTCKVVETTTEQATTKAKKEETTTQQPTTIKKEEITTHVHVYKETIIASTCTQTGYTEHICSCGARYVDNETPIKAHSYVAAITAKTCEKDGYTTYSCVCGDSYVGDIVEAGHDWLEATCEKPKQCEQCGLTEGDALGHSYSEYVCSKCGDEDEEGIAINPLLSLKKGVWYTRVTQREGYLILSHLLFERGSDKVMVGTESYDVIMQEVSEDEPWKVMYERPHVYNGITYYYVGEQGGYFYRYKLTDTEIILYDTDSEKVWLVLDLGLDGSLTVVEDNHQIPNVGIVYARGFDFD